MTLSNPINNGSAKVWMEHIDYKFETQLCSLKLTSFFQEGWELVLTSTISSNWWRMLTILLTHVYDNVISSFSASFSEHN